MTTQDVQNFFNTWNGKWCDFDHYYGAQCKDLFSQFNHDLVKAPYITGNPINLWYNPPSTLLKYYNKIKNTVTAVPKIGDVMIFNVGAYGHISICTSAANMFWFTSFDQNWPVGSPCHYVAHNYVSPKVMGWFRPKSL